MKIRTTKAIRRNTLVASISLVAILLAAPVASRADALFVSNLGNNTVDKFDLATGTYLTTFASADLNGPAGLALDNAGNLYVASHANHTIVKFTPSGVGSVFASTGLSVPMGLVFDSAGNLYAADINDTIMKITPSGVASVFAGNLQGAGLYGPTGLAFDSKGNLYAANFSGLKHHPEVHA